MTRLEVDVALGVCRNVEVFKEFYLLRVFLGVGVKVTG